MGALGPEMGKLKEGYKQGRFSERGSDFVISHQVIGDMDF